jgi:heparan-alpha-glucosaminide N-acetyltransferase
MIFVNYGAGNYMILDHAKWNGLNLADLLFPTFVWTQGVSMAISFESLRKKQASGWDMSKKVIIRAIKLYALGCFLNGGAELNEWRLLGVLQYFAMSYLIVGLLDIFARPTIVDDETTAVSQDATVTSINGVVHTEATADKCTTFASFLPVLWHDVGRYWIQWAIMGALGSIYICIQTLMPVSGCPTGYIGAGGWANQGQYPQCTGGAHRTVDMAIFGLHHMYHK